jgi:hypothetical protein
MKICIWGSAAAFPQRNSADTGLRSPGKAPESALNSLDKDEAWARPT